jgi:hypothetical protein
VAQQHRPQAFVEGLPQELQAEYLSEYQSRIDAAYPERADGKRLLAFPDFSWWLSASHDERTGSPRQVLLDAQGGAQRLPVCDHYSGVEARMRKSLQLQAEMMAEFGTCVFDVTLDCEDGAPVGQEAEHARLVVELARGAPGARVAARVHAVEHALSRQTWTSLPARPADKLCHIMIPKVESVDDVHLAEAALQRATAVPLHVLIESPAAVHRPSTSPPIRPCRASPSG